MIEMWDGIFSQQKPAIGKALARGDANRSFELMHEELDRTWQEAHRVLKSGGFACINIGDATRTIKDHFALYPNHMRIQKCMMALGFTPLPCILWRKQTNAPNKFMGSGMLPAGAYVTLEHEYILIFRKGPKRTFKTETDKANRHESAIFWEERNTWFSDVWFDIKGSRQGLSLKADRSRSGAFPFELAYRLTNMYSAKGDTVLDPYMGTGTTMAAAIASGRNSRGYEIDPTKEDGISHMLERIIAAANGRIADRLQQHLSFVRTRTEAGKPIKHVNRHYGFPVITLQEKSLLINDLTALEPAGKNAVEITYATEPQTHAVWTDAEEGVLTETIAGDEQTDECLSGSKTVDRNQLPLFD
jgi:DNA modification methylase